VLVHGGYTVQRALAAGVLDEVQIHQVPVLFGGGRRLFEALPSRVELEIVRVIDTPEATHIRYRRNGRGRQRLEPGVTMTLPGRGSATAAQGPVEGCNRHAFCIYEDVNFRQARFDMIDCKRYDLIDYRFIDKHGRSDTRDNEASSWVNNQSGGAIATLFSEDRPGTGTSFKSSGLKDNRVGPKWNDNVERIRPC
jgi:hypothetical protein